MVADQLGDALPPDFSASVLQSIPVQAGGLYPISDVWYIDAGLDTTDRLRIHIAQFARGSPRRQAWTSASRIAPMASGLRAAPAASPVAARPRGADAARFLTGQPVAEAGLDGAQLAADLPTLLHGQSQGQGSGARRLSDAALVKLFRLLRLARRLLDLEAGTTAPGT